MHRNAPWTVVPCVVAESVLPSVATNPLPSPHRFFVTTLTPDVRRRYPFLGSREGVVPVQTVSAATDAWLHEMLQAVRDRHPVLMMADLKQKNAPTCLDDARALLGRYGFNGPLVVDDWVF